MTNPMDTSSSDRLSFDIVMPEGRVRSGTARLVVVPGEMGEIGVLPRHAPLISTLKPGLLTIYGTQSSDDSKNVGVERFYVGDGFVNIAPHGCVVLTEECLDAGDLDGPALAAAIEKAQDEMAIARTAAEVSALKKDLSYLQAKIAIVQHLTQKHH